MEDELKDADVWLTAACDDMENGNRDDAAVWALMAIAASLNAIAIRLAE